MAFDPRDPYDAAALYDMWLNCSHCPATFDFEPGGAIDLDYYHRIGQQARHDGWSVLPTRETADELVFTVLCPACTERLGVDGCEGRLEMAAPAIDEICRAMRDASGQAA
ncbi:hypothetical protein A11A3_08555 [Alcanivorax hongdengensis A-11-3]|uniref:Uncharacterized protein n=1 Tax=Alcanivorax hongdengensis A-11-3 TaxID=1177179 RepID=L0WCH8_9GAMM|nr:hypothetical protein [Alcanivorax hongdengensis]EKF74458.1 hypothetical protein A11A3_08555 [Alcanivorax hongdengensis A-11-3]